MPRLTKIQKVNALRLAQSQSEADRELAFQIAGHDRDVLGEIITTIYQVRGWNSVHGFLRRNKIPHKLTVQEYGLSTNSQARKEKYSALTTPLCFHLYNRGVKSGGWRYNVLRTQTIILL